MIDQWNPPPKPKILQILQHVCCIILGRQETDTDNQKDADMNGTTADRKGVGGRKSISEYRK